MALFQRKKDKTRTEKPTITLREFNITQAFDINNGTIDGGSPQQDLHNLFITDPYTVRDWKLRLDDAWYSASADELLNFSTQGMAFAFATEPWYGRNMRNSFWCRSATEGDIVRVHSGLARSAIDTMSSIIGKPTYSVSYPEDNKESITVHNPNPGANPPAYTIVKDRTKRLTEILDANDFWSIYESQKQRTLALGWGCYKIDALPGTFDEPTITWYDAYNVDFIKRGNRIISVVFKDWIIDEDGNRICVIETRTLTKAGTVLRIMCFRQTPTGTGGDAFLTPMTDEEIGRVPALRGVQKHIIFEGCKDLFAYPTMYIEEDSEMGKAANIYGRSILDGRVEVLDALDMALSQKANSVQKSTPMEYFNTDFLERDAQTGLPIMPHNYDRKYTSFHGGKTADGSMMSDTPVVVTQPAINFQAYDAAAVEYVKFFLHGWMSPATMGIDVSKQSTQESQREKEKITLYTRQKFAGRDQRALEALFRGILCLDEWMRSGKITKTDYEISVKFPEFADSSWEERLSVLGDALNAGDISPEEYMHRLYMGELKGDDYDRELQYLSAIHQPQPPQQAPDMDQEMMAAMMGGQ